MRESESTADLLNDEGAFTRLIDLISNPERNEDAVLHRMLMDLLYEMSRIQRIKPDDLGESRVSSAVPGTLAYQDVVKVLTMLI